MKTKDFFKQLKAETFPLLQVSIPSHLIWVDKDSLGYTRFSDHKLRLSEFGEVDKAIDNQETLKTTVKKLSELNAKLEINTVSSTPTETLFLLNVFLYATKHTLGEYKTFDDWRSVKRNRNQTRIDSTGCFNKFVTSSRIDIRKGNISVALKRTLSFLEAAFKGVFYNTSFFSPVSLSKLMSQAEIEGKDIGIEGKADIKALAKKLNSLCWAFPICVNWSLKGARERELFNVIAELITVIGEIDVLQHFYNLFPDAFNSQAKAQIVNAAILSGNVDYAKEVFYALKAQDAFNPETRRLECDLERADKIAKLADAENIDLKEIDNLSGVDFEELLIEKFNSLGIKARGTSASGDYGADIILETVNDTRIIVQCKRFKNKVNLKAVQEVVAATNHYSGDFGLVITNNGYLKSAIKLAESADIELWGRDQLIDLLAGDVSFSQIKDL